MKERYSKILEEGYKRKIMEKLKKIDNTYEISPKEYGVNFEQIIFKEFKIGYESTDLAQVLYFNDKSLKKIKFLNKKERDNIYNSIKGRIEEVIEEKGLRKLKELKIVLIQSWDGNLVFQDGEIYEERF